MNRHNATQKLIQKGVELQQAAKARENDSKHDSNSSNKDNNGTRPKVLGKGLTNQKATKENGGATGWNQTLTNS